MAQDTNNLSWEYAPAVLTFGVVSSLAGTANPGSAFTLTDWATTASTVSSNVFHVNWQPATPEELERHRKEGRARKRAELRARKLFKRLVGAAGYERFLALGYHEVRGASGRLYRFAPEQRAQVLDAEGRDVAEELCLYLPGNLPGFDLLVVEHLMLSAGAEGEAKLIQAANRYPREARAAAAAA